MSPFMILVLVVVVIIAFVIVTYNKMIKMRNHADEAWSDIDVQLKRRYNLIPNIVETVKGYAAHEEGVLTKVTEARNMAINAGGMKEQAQAENMLSGALKSLFAVAENYPDLKANENFMQLQNELVDTEDKIQAARRFYNSTVRDFNTKLQQFPNSMVAKMFKFEDKEFFEVEDEEQRENVEVSFDKDKKEDAAPTETPAAEASEAPAEEKPAEAAPEAPAEEKKEEAPAPTPEAAPTEAPAEEPKAEETTAAETPAEEAAPSAPAEEAKPAEPEAPAPEAPAAPEQPTLDGMAEGSEAPAEAPAEEKKEEAPVAEATETPAAPDENKTEEAPAETPAEGEEKKAE